MFAGTPSRSVKGLLMSLPPTDRPTDQPTDRPDPYYQYRLTVSFSAQPDVLQILTQYSKDWAFCMHKPDSEDSSEHFHIVMRDFDNKKIDAFRKAVCKHFARQGNGLHAGKLQTGNHVSRAIGYFKHEPDCEIQHSGQSYWQDYIDNEPAFVKNAGPSAVLKERPNYPVLTYGNVLKQAIKYRTEHSLRTDSLSDIVEEMVNTHNWWPCRELLVNGIPAETHQRFSDMVKNKRTKLSFWLPHERSDKKLEWLDRVATGCYSAGVSSSGPGDSKRLWKDRDFTSPP